MSLSTKLCTHTINISPKIVIKFRAYRNTIKKRQSIPMPPYTQEKQQLYIWAYLILFIQMAKKYYRYAIFLGFQMPAWFDLYSLDPSGQEDDRGIEKSKQYITNLIEQEINNGIDPSRIVLGGTYFHF